MMPFSTGTGLERVRVVGSDLDCWRVGMQALGLYGLRLDCCTIDLQALDVALLCKNKEKGVSVRATPCSQDQSMYTSS